MLISIDEGTDTKDLLQNSNITYLPFSFISEINNLQHFYSEYSSNKDDLFFVDEYYRFEEISESILEIVNGEQFSFYDLMLKQEHLDLL